MSNKKKRYWLSATLIIGIVFLLSATGYTVWTVSDPVHTCTQCHEIKANHESWLISAHADIQCIDCHGTALSNGIHSLQEKGKMILSHFSKKMRNSDIRLSEAQVLEVSARCAECHRSEHAGWLRGGHGITYADIFLDGDHNRMERPYADCFRCHGMFYEGNLQTLMGDLPDNHADYQIIDKKQMNRAAIPCLACHQMHTEAGDVPKTALYVRSEKMYLRTDYLSKVPMQDNGRPVLTDNDPNSRLCMQCHSPNAWHQAGSEDDRTLTGVHEGLSCLACHNPHSNETLNSCDACHPALDNCGLDVKTMNTTYFDKMSPNNIHHISCTSCHEDRKAL